MYRWILCIEICLFKISVVLCERQNYTLVGNIYVSRILFKERNRLFKTFWICEDYRRHGICYNVLSIIGDIKSIFLLWIHYIPRNMDTICVYCDYAPMTAHIPLRWRHNERNGVSNHQPHDCLLGRLFRHRSKKTSKFRVTGLGEGNSSVTGTPGHRAQRDTNVKNVSMWWRRHGSWFLKLAPGQFYDHPSTSEVTLTTMGNYVTCLHRKHNKTIINRIQQNIVYVSILCTFHRTCKFIFCLGDLLTLKHFPHKLSLAPKFTDHRWFSPTKEIWWFWHR